MVKSGSDHLVSLRDGRHVFIDGGFVDDVTTHPAFRNAVQSAATLYDFQADPANQAAMTFVSPDTGRRVSRSWQLPRSYADLLERRRALERWAELHFGFMGRSPDHVASCISGMVMGIEQFEQHDARRAAAVRDYYRYARDNDLFVTYMIIDPQTDHSRPPQADADTDRGAVGIKRNEASGIEG